MASRIMDQNRVEPLPQRWYDVKSVDYIVDYIDRNPEWIKCKPLVPFESHPFQRAIIGGASLDMIRAVYNGNPLAICTGDWEGCLPLHTAAANERPKEVFQFLLSEYPGACKVPDNHGRIPIMHIDEDSVDDDIIELLFNAYPESISLPKLGLTVLHRLVQKRNVSTSLLMTIVTKQPGALRVLDIDENLPIHYAMQNDAIRASYRSTTNSSATTDNDIVRYMLQKYPESATMKNYLRKSLLEMAVVGDYPTNVIQAIMDANVNAVKEKICDETGDLVIHSWFLNFHGSRPISKSYTTSVLLITAYPESLAVQNDELETPLHILLRSLYSCRRGRPNSFYVPMIVSYIIDKCPESLRVADTEGVLPLHQICYVSRSPVRTLVENGGFLSMFYKILESYPHGTHIVDGSGHLPIRAVVLSNLTPLELLKQSILRSLLDKLLRTFPQSIWEVMNEMMDHNLLKTEIFYRKFLEDHLVQYPEQYMNQPIVYYDRNKAELVQSKDILFSPMVFRDDRCSVEQFQVFIQHYPQSLVQYSYDITQLDVNTIRTQTQDGADIVHSNSYQPMKLAAVTPLQLLCMNKKLLSTMIYSDMETILKLCPEAANAKTINWVAKLNNEQSSTTTGGYLPIFLACQYDAPLDVILCLLEYSFDQLFM